MSDLIVVFTRGRQTSLARSRPAWVEQEHREGFCYYREDHNTPWLRVDAEGQFLGMSDLVAMLEPVRSTESPRVALVRVQNGESIDNALTRARDVGVALLSDGLMVDAAVVLDSEAR